MSLARSRTIESAENVAGGEGEMLRDRLLNESQMNGICTYVVHNALVPGASIGDHEHRGENEMYFITAGKGLYIDNDTTYEVVKGDVLFCEDGDHHGITNTGDENLSFVAIIQATK